MPLTPTQSRSWAPMTSYVTAFPAEISTLAPAAGGPAGFQIPGFDQLPDATLRVVGPAQKSGIP
jgi:hypothetical protein